MDIIQSVRWSPDGQGVRIIDQRRLPEAYVERDLRTLDDVCDAIATLAVRGAPAIGAAGAMGLVVALEAHADDAPETPEAMLRRAREYAARIGATRPTAVNLPWALGRMLARARGRAGDADGGRGGGPGRSAAGGTAREAYADTRVAGGRATDGDAGRGGPPPWGSYDGNGGDRSSNERTEWQSSARLLSALREEATVILEEDRVMCRAIGEHGLALIPDGARIITHCNAGALATAGIGTALAPVYLAAAAGRRVEVLVDETRPLLQGSRLTAWELDRAGIPVTVMTDGMAASVMRTGRVDLCIVGADRIAANGDVANKIGTYALAVAARHHGVPFYVAAPSSTFDPATARGDDIVIEQRSPDEVRRLSGRAVAPPNVRVHNPAFDVTPAALVSAIVSDRGVHRPPYAFARPTEPAAADPCPSSR